eukprot:scaffold134825_cov34-Prasinocladus_malaysianus.AAC.1
MGELGQDTLRISYLCPMIRMPLNCKQTDEPPANRCYDLRDSANLQQCSPGLHFKVTNTWTNTVVAARRYEQRKNVPNAHPAANGRGERGTSSA